MQPWERLPGVERRKEFRPFGDPDDEKDKDKGGWYLIEGLLSIRGETAGDVALRFRHGLSPARWLFAPCQWGDSFVAIQNTIAGVDLCKECDGTGNWLHSMFKACPECYGTGGAGGTGVRGKK